MRGVAMESDLYIALYGISKNKAGEVECQSWVTDRMRELETLSDGIQLADENLGARPFRFLAESHLKQLEKIRANRDPNSLFHAYMGVPQ